MAKEIKFSLVYRDMWQSSGKYVPRIDQLKEVAPAIIDMGCFDRVETNGGAFEQVNLLFGENPNSAVREWTAPFHKVGIQTHMLERGLNALRMNPVPADVRELMYKVKKAQGTDISRSFCGLNDHRNLRLSVEYAKKAGMISQVALSITNSPVHTVEYYMGVVDHVVEYGCDEICLKDMAGIGRPSFLAELTARIKKKYPHITVQYHGHCGPGFSPASMLEVARAGADYLDVSFADGNGTNAVWWGWTTTGTNVYWKEHKGTVDANGNLTGMQFSHNGSYKSISCASEIVDGEIYWYLAYPREYVDTFNATGKIYVSALLWNAYANYWAIPARGGAMLEVTLP